MKRKNSGINNPVTTLPLPSADASRLSLGEAAEGESEVFFSDLYIYL
jgi:hypothetical protein